jgi:hypothetical protein
MSTHEDLAVGYHQQDTDYYCGAACAQMVLHTPTVGEPLLSQVDLYNDNHSHSTTESGWYTAPDGLQWTLNNRQSGKYFCLDALDSEDAISRMICWTIHHYQVAPVAMVYGWAHWIVVRGYTASATPGWSGDTAYSISGFDVNNPWPPTPTPAPPPPHTDGDVCGGGGARGVADEHLTYATWQSDYMTGIPSGHWAGKFVAVCDPDPPPSPFGERPPPVNWRLLPGDRLLSAKRVVSQVPRALKRAGLFAHERWGPRLEAGQPGRPVLVQRLDRADSYYWIVLWEGETPAAVSIDARFGNYRQAIALPGRESDLLAHHVEHTEVPRLIDHVMERAPLRVTRPAGSVVLRPEGISVHPALVWMPCRESLSPFYPFRMITAGGMRLFIRVFDGAVFTRLSTEGRGI